MINIVANIIFTLFLIAMASVILYLLSWMIVDSYYFKVRYIDITGHCRMEYFSVRAASLKRAYKKARRYANESCMSHEYIDFMSLM